MWAGYKKGLRGFTFIELNLVAVLIAVIGLVIYSSFSAGAKIWQRAKDNIPEADAHIFLDRLSLDIRNAFKISQIRPHGTSSDLSFASYAVVNSPSGFGRIRYSFDVQKGQALRYSTDFSQLAGADDQEKALVLLNNVKGCSFKYYYFNVDSKEGVWKNAMEEVLPSAVKIEVSVALNNNKAVTLSKTISLYASN